MRLSILWRIMEIEEGVIHRGRGPRRITPSEISIILHMIRKPNSITVVLFIQKNSQFRNIAKTSLLASILSLSSIVYVQVCPAPQIFSKQQMSPSKLSSCCFCYVFSHYFAQFQLFFLLLKRVKSPPFQFLQVFLVNGALTCRRLHF